MLPSPRSSSPQSRRARHPVRAAAACLVAIALGVTVLFGCRPGPTTSSVARSSIQSHTIEVEGASFETPAGFQPLDPSELDNLRDFAQSLEPNARVTVSGMSSPEGSPFGLVYTARTEVRPPASTLHGSVDEYLLVAAREAALGARASGIRPDRMRIAPGDGYYDLRLTSSVDRRGEPIALHVATRFFLTADHVFVRIATTCFEPSGGGMCEPLLDNGHFRHGGIAALDERLGPPQEIIGAGDSVGWNCPLSCPAGTAVSGPGTKHLQGG